MMQSHWNGNKVILKGDSGLERSKVSLKSMMKLIRRVQGGIQVELNQVELRSQETMEVPAQRNYCRSHTVQGHF